MTIVFWRFFRQELENNGKYSSAKLAVQWLQIAQMFTMIQELAIFAIFASRLENPETKERYLRYRATGAILSSIVLMSFASWSTYVLYSLSSNGEASITD